MDFSKFKTSDWLMIGGAAGVLVFGLFSWSESVFGESANAFDFTFTGTIPWLLIVAFGVLALLRAGGVLKDTAPWPLILLAMSALGAALIVIRLLIGPKIDVPGGTVTLDRGFGLYISAIAAVAAAAGAFMNFTASGGNLKDLTDRNKIKDSFNRGS